MKFRVLACEQLREDLHKRECMLRSGLVSAGQVSEMDDRRYCQSPEERALAARLGGLMAPMLQAVNDSFIHSC